MRYYWYIYIYTYYAHFFQWLMRIMTDTMPIFPTSLRIFVIYDFSFFTFLACIPLQLCHGEQALEQSGGWHFHQTGGLIAKWAVRNCRGLTVRHHCWLGQSCTTVSAASFSAACFTWWTSFRSHRPSWTLRVSRWRQPYSCCTAAKG